MLDLVYLVGRGSRANNTELRYSLRSVERYVAGVRHVVIVGYPPAWLSDETIRIDLPDETENKVLNQMRGWLHIADREEITPRFIELHDDMIFLREIDLREMPYWHRGELRDRVQQRRVRDPRLTGTWNTALRNTIAALDGANPPARDYEVHGPIMYERDLFSRIVRPYMTARNPILHRSLYCNEYRVASDLRADTKLFGNNPPPGGTHAGSHVWRGWDLISLSNPLPTQARFRSWLSGQFPSPSKYERMP